MNMLAKTSPHFSTSGSWTQSGQTFTNGDLVITYVLPAGVTSNDPRTGQELTVKAVYHQDLVDPAHLDLPAAGRGRSVAR